MARNGQRKSELSVEEDCGKNATLAKDFQTLSELVHITDQIAAATDIPRGPGRPKKSLDAGLIERLSMIGMTILDIAFVLGCNEKTLRNRMEDTPGIQEAYDKGKGRFRMALRMWQAREAAKGDVPMLKFLGKNELGQSDRFDGKIEIDVESRSEVILPLPVSSDAYAQAVAELKQRGQLPGTVEGEIIDLDPAN